MILGPFDLGVTLYQENSTMLLNMSKGNYDNIANATGTDMLGLTVVSHDVASCIIKEKPPDDVGGVIMDAISNEQRYAVYSVFAGLLVAVLYLVFKKQ